MTKLWNEISINARIETIWEALSNIEALEHYDPTVLSSRALTPVRSGFGAIRKAEMKDGKNWFEERVSEWRHNEALTYELTACSFPVNQLRHSYSFERSEEGIVVKQVMEYQMRFGLMGKILDFLFVRKKSDGGIKKFFSGLKAYVEAR
jgi:uncharacterized protein YndB with AHSA1/START domain